MTQNKIRVAVLGICLATGASLAQAQAPTINRGIYVGGALGQSEAKAYDCTALPQCENHGSVGRAFFGLQFGRNWAIEAAFTDLGQVNSANPGTGFTESVKVRLSELDLVWSYPASARLAVYAKGGVYYAQTTNDFTLGGVPTRLKESNAGPTWGGGLHYFVTDSIAIRGEAQRYMKVGGGNIGDSDYNAYTIGILWKGR